MLAIRLAGVPRFIVARGLASPPDNSDGPDLSEAMAGGRLPSFVRSGINWTRHVRRTPAPPKPRGTSMHLTVVK
jgi:hypothetical protein